MKAVLEEEKKVTQKVPEALIYEMTPHGPIYYRDYEKVLSGEKQLEQVMGSSYLQAYLVSLIIKHFNKYLSDDYIVLSNELGLKYAKKSWRAADIAIYENKLLKDVPLQNKYLEVPPKVVIEVDTKASVTHLDTPNDYIMQKTDDLLDFGVEKVIWIFTNTKKVMIAESNHDWIVKNWNAEVEVVEDIKFSIEKILQK